MVQESVSFSLGMSYKPPVKSSVKKLYDRRFQSSNSPDEASGRRPVTRKSAHAAAISSPAPAADFEQRMRDLLFRPESRTKKAPNRRAMSIPSNVVTVNTLGEYKAAVGDETSRIVAVRFHATYCRACMAVAPHFYKIAKMNPDVLFVDMPVTESNAALHQGLGVPSLPYAHIYHPQTGLVEEMKLTRNEIPTFREKLEGHKGSFQDSS